MGSTRSSEVRFKTFVNADPRKIWQLISTAEGWKQWFVSEMKLDPKPGGAMEFYWKDFGPDKVTVREPGEVVALEEARRFAYKWVNRQRYWTDVVISIEGNFDGATVEVVETGFPEGDEGHQIALENSSGWGQALTMLKYFVEHGVTYSNPL